MANEHYSAFIFDTPLPATRSSIPFFAIKTGCYFILLYLLIAIAVRYFTILGV